MEKERKGRIFSRLRDPNYQVREICTPDGKIRNELIYLGDHYIPALSDKQLLGVKVLHSILTVLTLTLCVYGGCQRSMMNVYAVSAMLQAVMLLLQVVRGVLVIQYWTAPKRMTKWEYQVSVKYLKLVSLLSALCGLGLVIVGAVCLMKGDSDTTATVIGMAAYLLSGLAGMGSVLVQRTIVYEIDSSARRTQGVSA